MRSLFDEDMVQHTKTKEEHLELGNITFRRELIELARRHILINEVSLTNGQSLFGVEIEAVEADFAIFHEAGSAGLANVSVPLNQIVYIDTDRSPLSHENH